MLVSTLSAAVVLAASPYDVNPVTDGLATAAMFGVLAIAEAAVKPSLDGGITCRTTLPTGRCDPSKLDALDRSTVGDHSKAWSTVSDVGAVSSFVLPAVADAIDVWRGGGENPAAEYAADVLVMAESVAFATSVTTVLKYAVRRPRPTQYREGAYVGSAEHQLSFPSGHTTSASAAAAAYATTFALRHPDSPWRFVVVGAGVALASVTAYGRVAGGWHFYTDVLAGALVGGASGIVLPLLHRHGVEVALDGPVPGGGAGLAATVTWRF